MILYKEIVDEDCIHEEQSSLGICLYDEEQCSTRSASSPT
jgi:hypothetical protein